MQWFLGPSITGLVTWAGTILSLGGLLLTYLQVVRARDAAAAAEVAAKAAERAVRGKFQLANAAYSFSQLDSIKGLVLAGYLTQAQLMFSPVKRTVTEACSPGSTRAFLDRQIEQARTNLRIIDHQLDLGIGGDEDYNRNMLMSALRGVSDFLIERENDLKREHQES